MTRAKAPRDDDDQAPEATPLPTARALHLKRYGLVERNGWTYPLPAGTGRPPGPLVRAIGQLLTVETVYSVPVTFTASDRADRGPGARGQRIVDRTWVVEFTTPRGLTEVVRINHSDAVETSPEWPKTLRTVAVTRRKADQVLALLEALEDLGEHATESVFDRTGWVERPAIVSADGVVNGELVFAQAGGPGVSAAGADPSVRVQWAGDYGDHYERHGLVPSDPETRVSDVQTLLMLGEVGGPKGLGAASLGQTGFVPLAQFTPTGTSPAKLVTGTTGTNKTAYVQLGCAAWGEVHGIDRQPDVNMRNLKTTGYAIEQLLIPTAPMLLDDALRQADGPKTREKFYDLVSAIGSSVTLGQGFKRSRWNQGKRGSFADPLYPSAAVTMVAEVAPAPAEHASDLARWMWFNVRHGEITHANLAALQTLEACQAMRRAVWGYLEWLAGKYGRSLLEVVPARIDAARVRFAELGLHVGLPPIYARAFVGVEMLLEYAVAVGALTPGDAGALLGQHRADLAAAAQHQAAGMGVSGGAAAAATDGSMYVRGLRDALRTGAIAIQGPLGKDTESRRLIPPRPDEIPLGVTMHDLGWGDVGQADWKPKRPDAWTAGRLHWTKATKDEPRRPVLRVLCQRRDPDRDDFLSTLSDHGQTMTRPVQLPGPPVLFEQLTREGYGGEKPLAVKGHSNDWGADTAWVVQFELGPVFGLDDDDPDRRDDDGDQPPDIDPADLTRFTNTEPVDLEQLEDQAATDTGPAEQSAEQPATQLEQHQLTRWRPLAKSVTAYVDLETGHGITSDGRTFTARRDKRAGRLPAASILAALPEDVARVQALGLPELTGGTREWITADVPRWSADGHYLAKADNVVGRWRRDSDGRRVALYRIETWFGRRPESPEQARDAMAAILDAIQVTHRGQGATRERDSRIALFATPAQTGRDLWRHSAGASIDRYAPLPADVQDLIRSTSGQGRIELSDKADLFTTADERDKLPGLVVQDLTFGYAGLVGELGSGPAELLTGAQAADLWASNPYARGRAEVRVTVPAGWDHVGLLGVKADSLADGWQYPAEPGRTFTTWADASELHLATQQGWGIDYLSGLHLTSKGRPLDTWARRLISAWGEHLERRQVAGEITPEVARLARKGLRAIVLHGIGAFHGRPQPQTRIGTITDVPAGARDVRQLEDGRVQWTDTRPAEGIPAETSHPEWSTAVWARCRRRLLIGPNGNVSEGALFVPRADLVAMRTDALYLTTDPGWNSNKPGRFRRKASAPGPVPTPRTWLELDALRNSVLGGE